MLIQQLLRLTIDRGASDLHLNAPGYPVIRVHGNLLTLKDQDPLTANVMQQAFESITTDQQKQQFDSELELDFSYEMEGEARFRVNTTMQRGTIGLTFRQIGLAIPTLDELGLPPICKTLALKQKGLILVTGPTGCGKSTTLAAMIEHLNQQQARRVVTIEDPIEYLYEAKACLITQRELGRDTHSFASALKHVLRQDPDVILVGEMRDLETISASLTAAETGHLVMSTLHTNTASSTIDRIIDVFPAHQQGQIRTQLSLTLAAVLTQVLVPRHDSDGRVAAVEVMIATPALRNLIREGKTHQMMNVIQTGSQHKMQTMEQALKELQMQGLIGMEDAMMYANNKEAFRSMSSTG